MATSRRAPTRRLFVAAGGVDDRLTAAAKAHPEPVIVLTADDVVGR